VALSRRFGFLTLFAVGAEGVRIVHKRKEDATPRTKFIAGVPMINYHTAYEGVEGAEALVEGETEGEWVVIVNPGTSDAQIERLCREATPHGCKASGNPSKGGVPFLEMRGREQDLEALILSFPGVVKFIEPDTMVSMIPELEAQPEAAAWGLNRVGADQRGRTGASTTIFVVDSGVRTTHVEFGSRASPGLDVSVGSPGKECNGDLTCAEDTKGHGTHCAGTAAGASYGVAPGARVVSIKTLNKWGIGLWSWTYTALNWMATSPVRPAVASMSLGGLGEQQAMREAVDSAVSAGVTVVVAGGNDNVDACTFSPAFVPSAITVGSITSTDARSPFSNYGSCTNIWAPGSEILSTSHDTDTGSTMMSGTSMACPHVAGAAAIALDADPSKAPAKVLAELLEKADKGVITDLTSDDTNALVNVASY